MQTPRAEFQHTDTKEDGYSPSFWDSFRPFGALIFLFGVGFVALAFNVLALESRLIEAMALNDARSYSRALTEFRTLYTSEVIERVRHGGVEVTHNYLEEDGAIPLPATLSLILGNRLNDESGASVRLYSAHPFPWRRAEGGPKDDFEVHSLQSLNRDPSQSVFEFETLNNRTVLRFATADLMRESCVDCHNNHPSSPKRDWEIGDIRGVLSVTKPLAPTAAEAQFSQRVTVTLMLGFGLWGMLLLAIAGTRHRQNAIRAQQFAGQTARANKRLERQILEKEMAEAERRQMEEQVRYSQKLETVGILAGGIAHDFNNLLQVLLGNTEMALHRMDAKDDQRARTHLDKVIDVSTRASKLTHQLLVYAGRAPVLKQATNISTLVEDMRPLLQTVTGGEITIRYELSESIALVHADPTQLQQVLLNLITNAAEACEHPEQSVVVVRSQVEVIDDARLKNLLTTPGLRDGEYVVFEVEDNGCGIGKERVERIFDPFYTTKQGGRGLGLAVIQGIVRAHGGAIEVQSSESSGTTFRILLPTTTDHLAPAEITTEPKQAQRFQESLILLVDDQRDVAYTLGGLLEEEGYQVVTVHDGHTAIQRFQESPGQFSLVLLDVRMPGLSGLNTFHALREIDPTVPVILSSGDAPAKDVQILLDKGIFSFLQKPYTGKQLLALVSQVTTSSDTT